MEPWLSRVQHLRRKHLSPPSESQLVLAALATLLGSIVLSMSAPLEAPSLLASLCRRLGLITRAQPSPASLPRCVKDTSRQGGGVQRLPVQSGRRGRALAASDQGLLGVASGSSQREGSGVQEREHAEPVVSQVYPWRQQTGGLFCLPQSHSRLGLRGTSRKARTASHFPTSAALKALGATLHRTHGHRLHPGPGKAGQGT